MNRKTKIILFLIFLTLFLFVPLPYIHLGNVVCKPGQINCPQNNQIVLGQSIFQFILTRLKGSSNLRIDSINEKDSKPFVAKEGDNNYCENQTDCVLYSSPQGDPAGQIFCISRKGLKKNDPNILTEDEISKYPGTCECLLKSKRCFHKFNR